MMSAMVWWLGWLIPSLIWPNQLLKRVKILLFLSLWLFTMTVTSSMTSSVTHCGVLDHHLSYLLIILKKSVLSKKIYDDVIDDVIRGSSMTICTLYSESVPTYSLSDLKEIFRSESIWPSWWLGKMMSSFCQMMSGIVTILVLMMSLLLKFFMADLESMTPNRLSKIKVFFGFESICLRYGGKQKAARLAVKLELRRNGLISPLTDIGFFPNVLPLD